MNNKVMVYGLTKEQQALLRAAMPDGYDMAAAESVTDLIAADAVCYLISEAGVDIDNVHLLENYYAEVGDYANERVVWIGVAPPCKAFSHYDCLPDMMPALDDILQKAQQHYEMKAVHCSEYAMLSSRAIADSLEQDIITALHRKYGDDPDPVILARMRQEWTATAERNCVLDVAALYDTTQWLKKAGHPYWMSGFAGSSFLLYLLGITSTNPLPPHLHCPKCHRVIWKKEYKDGFDIPPAVCEHDGTPMIADGHNIPWQSFWGYGDYKPEFIVYLCADAREDVSAWLKGHWLRKYVTEPNEKAIPYILSRLRFGFGFHTESAFHQAQIDASCIDAVICYVRERMVWQGKILETGLSFPGSFADAVATLGIFDEMCGNDVLQKLVRSGIPASDLIVFREDVFSCLQKHGFVEKAAWQGMMRVWEGSSWPDTDNGIPDQCKANMHRYSKADVLELLFFRIKSGRI